MLFELLVIFELFILYLLSRKVINILWQLLYKLTRNVKITVYLMAFLFLPGTLLHEVSHWLMAKLLFVHTGRISLWPKLNNNNMQFGSVSIAKSDPIRRVLIGTAPVFIGISIIITILYFAPKSDLLNNQLMMLLLSYAIFAIGNTMFSSKKDMEGAFILFIFFLLSLFIFYLLGFRIPISDFAAFFSHQYTISIFQKAYHYLLFPIIIDLIFILMLKIARR